MFGVRYAVQWTFGRLTPLRYRFETDYKRVISPKITLPPNPSPGGRGELRRRWGEGKYKTSQFFLTLGLLEMRGPPERRYSTTFQSAAFQVMMSLIVA